MSIRSRRAVSVIFFAILLFPFASLGAQQVSREQILESQISSTSLKTLEIQIATMPTEKIADSTGQVKDVTDVPIERYRVIEENRRSTPTLVQPSITSSSIPTALPSTSSTSTSEAREPKLRPGFTEFIRTTPEQDKNIVGALQPNIVDLLEDADSSIVTLPGAIRQADKDGDLLLLKPLALLSRKLRYEPSTGMFEGSILVGVSRIGEGQRVSELSAPLTFQIFGGSAANPNPLNVVKTGPHLTK